MKCAQKTMLIFEQNVELGNMHKIDIDKESPLGGQRRSIRQTDTFLFVPSHTAGAP